MNPDLDKRGSKNNIFPNSTIPTFFGAAALIGWIGSFADVAVEVTTAPIDSSDTSSVLSSKSILLKMWLYRSSYASLVNLITIISIKSEGHFSTSVLEPVLES